MIHLLRRRVMLHRQKASRSFVNFVDKVNQIRRAIDGAPDPDYTLHSGSSFNAFKHITTKEMEDLITASPNN